MLDLNNNTNSSTHIDSAKVNKSTLGLPMFCDVHAQTPRNKAAEVRGIIGEGMMDPALCEKILSHLAPEGKAGNRAYDQCMASVILMEFAPELNEIYGLNQMGVWKHLEFVLRKRGYIFSGGRCVSHALLEIEDKSAETHAA